MASLYTLFALRDAGARHPRELGIAIGCGGIGGLVGARSPRPRQLRWGTRRTLIGSLAITAMMQVFIPLAPAVPWIAMTCLIAAQVVGDGAMTVYLVNETTLRQRLLPREALGRAARDLAGRGRLADAHRRVARRGARRDASACARRSGYSLRASASAFLLACRRAQHAARTVTPRADCRSDSADCPSVELPRNAN